MNQLLAIGVFLFTYALIVLKPKKINEAHAALIGSILAVIFLLKPHQVLEALGISTQEMPVPLVTILFQVLRLSTIGAGEFNGRVRDGIGYRPPAKTTSPAKDE